MKRIALTISSFVIVSFAILAQDSVRDSLNTARTECIASGCKWKLISPNLYTTSPVYSCECPTVAELAESHTEVRKLDSEVDRLPYRQPDLPSRWQSIMDQYRSDDSAGLGSLDVWIVPDDETLQAICPECADLAPITWNPTCVYLEFAVRGGFYFYHIMCEEPIVL